MTSKDGIVIIEKVSDWEIFVFKAAQLIGLTRRESPGVLHLLAL
jgi:hypothetical protein